MDTRACKPRPYVFFVFRFLCADVLPVGLTISEQADTKGDQQAEECQAADDIPPGVAPDYLGDPRIVEGANDVGKAGAKANRDTEPEQRHREDTQAAKMGGIAPVQKDDINKEESNGDGPDNRERGSVDGVEPGHGCRRGGADSDRVWHDDEDDDDEDHYGDQDGADGLEDGGVRGHAVPIKLAQADRDAPVDGGYHEDTRGGIGIEDGRADTIAQHTDGHKGAREFAERGIYGGDDLKWKGLHTYDGLPANNQEGENANEVAGKDNERSPEQVTRNDVASLLTPAISDLAGHIEGADDPQEAKYSGSEEPEIGGCNTPIVDVPETGGCYVSCDEPGKRRHAGDDNGSQGQHNDDIDQVLNSAEAACCYNRRHDDQPDHQKSLLPGFGDPAGIKALNERCKGVGGQHDGQHAAEPEADPDEEAPVAPQRFVRPVVERTFVRKYGPKLRCGDDAWQQKNEGAQHYVGERGRPPGCDDGGVGDEEERDDV